MTKLVDSEYLRRIFHKEFGKELIPKYWSNKDEDSIYCECIEDPSCSGYYYYLFLQDFGVYTNI